MPDLPQVKQNFVCINKNAVKLLDLLGFQILESEEIGQAA